MINSNLFSRAPSPPPQPVAPGQVTVGNSAASSNLDSLLRGLGQPPQSQPQPQQAQQQPQQQPQQQQQQQQSPQQPQPQLQQPQQQQAPVVAAPAPSPPAAERANAILSLLGSAVDSSPNPQDNQGKKLLDQLMASTQPQPSPPPQAPSPGRKTMFEFVSPFDALASSPGSKRKPVPQIPQQDATQPPQTTYEDPAIVSASRETESPHHNQVTAADRAMEAKMTMENLMEQLTRPPLPPVPHQADLYGVPVYPQTYFPEPQGNTYPSIPHDTYHQSSPPPRAPQGPPPPLAPKPPSPIQRNLQQQQPQPQPQQLQQQQQARPPSPRPSPPRLVPTPPLRRTPPPRQIYEDAYRVEAAQQQQRMFNSSNNESPAGSGRDQQGGQSPPQRYAKATKEGGSRNKGSGPDQDPRGRPSAKKQQQQQQQQQQAVSQVISIDVAQPLTSTLAPREAVAVTPIALLKLDSIYVPGSTIGVSSWIAYAMTKGRVRLIARSNGARALLKLPTAFPPTSSVVDMVCSANRLAGVTSDGGLVVWEVPNMIDDDLPSKLLLCVLPTAGPNAFKTVKWQPRHPSMLAVGSDKEIHLINVDEALDRFRGEPIRQFDLDGVRTLFSVPSTLVSFAFDVPHYAIASISVDSTLTMWSIRDKLPFWSSKILGESTPSSIDFMDGAMIIGRKQGTIVQLVPIMSTTAVSTVKFVNSAIRGEDKDMFGHVGYDPRISTLWVANSRRESLMALRVYFEPASSSTQELIKQGTNQPTGSGFFEQVLEFPILHPTINLGILSAEAAANPIPNPHPEPGSEQKQGPPPPGAPGGPEMALVAFVIHTGGVDQVLINKEGFESSIDGAAAKLPNGSQYPVLEQKKSGQNLHGPQASQQVQQGAMIAPQNPPIAALVQQQQQQQLRSRTPLSDAEQDTGEAREEPSSRQKEPRAKPTKSQKELVKTTGNGNDSQTEMVTALAKEIRKVEENLHTRIGRLIAKELDKQHTRIEDGRQASQQADLTRQDMLLRLISNELTKNTTRVVELAIKNVVQTTVLPSLETITKDEVKAALNSQIVKGLSDSMKQTLPNEIERLLLRPDVSNHVARTFSSAVTPIIERHVKDAINKTLVPAYMQATSQLHQDLSSEIRGEILNLKKEIVSWQSKALQGHESLIQSMESSIRALSEQVKSLSTTLTSHTLQQQPQQLISHPVPHRSSPAPSINHGQIQPSHLRQGSHPPNVPTNNYAPTNYNQPAIPPPPATWYNPVAHVPPPQQPLQQPPQHQTNPLMGAPPPQQQPQQQQPAPVVQAPAPVAPPPPPPRLNEDWDGAFLGVLGTQDQRQLRELLARSNPETIMPTTPGAVSPLSQAVVLTLVHRLASALGETSPVDESFKSSLWWLQRAAFTLNPSDPVISPYVGRVVPNVKALLQTTSQRLALLPGGTPLIETNRMISDILQTINSKPAIQA